MSKLKMNRRKAFYLAGSLLLAKCTQKSSDEDRQANESKGMLTVNTGTAAWQRIHAWLLANAPKICDNLNQPATEDQISAAQKALGCALPQEYQDLYRTHDGMNSRSNFGSLFYGMQFLSLEQVIREHANSNINGSKSLPVRAADPGISIRDMHNTKWIAFAHSGETLIRIDLDPAPTGKVGQVIFTDHADNTVILMSNSISDFLLQFAVDLENRRYFLNKEAQEDGNQFLSCEPEVDVINWAFSPKWKHLAKTRVP